MVTNQCNLRCLYCYESHKKDTMMSFELARQAIIDHIHDERYDHISIEFMGGEPLLNFPLIRDIAEWIWESGIDAPYDLFASTNGTCLSDEMKEWFSQHSHQIELGLSFDGTPQVQDINRCTSAKNIDFEFFLRTWPSMSVKMTISTMSISHLYDSIVYLEQKGVDHIKADLAFMNGWDEKHLTVWSVELDRLINYYAHLQKESRCSLLQVPVENIFAEQVSVKRCGCGEDLVCIDCDGQQYPCQMFAPLSMSKECYDTVRNLDFSDERHFFVEQCSNCILKACCPSCYGCNLKYNGALNRINQFYCKAFIILFMKNLEYRMAMAQLIENEKERLDTLKDLEQIAEAIQLS